VFCLALMSFLSAITWVAFVIWLVIGLVVYFGYARSGRRARCRNPCPTFREASNRFRAAPGRDNLGRTFTKRLSMTSTYAIDTPGWRRSSRDAPPGPGHRRQRESLYFSLLDNPAASARGRAGLPAGPDRGRAPGTMRPAGSAVAAAGLDPGRAEAVGIAYREYLGARKNGAPRRYFGTSRMRCTS
jgi:hypothetical protein